MDGLQVAAMPFQAWRLQRAGMREAGRPDHGPNYGRVYRIPTLYRLCTYMKLQ